MKSAFLSLLNRQTFSHPSNAAETAYEAFTDHTDDYSVRTVSSDYEGFIRRYPEAFRKDSSAVILKHSGKSEICFIRIGLIPLTILQTGSEYSLPPVKQAVCTEPASDGAGF